MEENKEIQEETITVPKAQLATLVRKNKELEALTSATADLIFFVIKLIGGKIPKEFSMIEIGRILKKVTGFMTGGKIPQSDLQRLSEIIETLQLYAPVYLSANQLKELEATGLMEFMQKHK